MSRTPRPPGPKNEVGPRSGSEGTTTETNKAVNQVGLTVSLEVRDHQLDGARERARRKRLDSALANWRRMMLDPLRFDATGRALVRAELMAASMAPAEISSNSVRLLAKLDADLSHADWFALACLVTDVQATGRGAGS